MDYSIRVACYERVSTEEQSKHGLSIDAQIAALGRWVSDQHHILVGHYTDAGVSGGKPIDKRPAMWRLLQDIQSGLVDLVIFTKLDRWFRSLKNYYKAQEILDGSHCAWQAIDEDYETLTASGRFKVNIMLSVAQQERERTSERVRTIFDYRAAKGEFLSGGHAVPFGYKVEDKHLVKDPEREPAVNRLFEMILAGAPTGTAVRQVREEYQEDNIRRSSTHCFYRLRCIPLECVGSNLPPEIAVLPLASALFVTSQKFKLTRVITLSTLFSYFNVPIPYADLAVVVHF